MSKKIELFKLSAVEIYKLVLSGKLKHFPMYFWQDNDIHEYIEIIKFMIKDILKWTDDDIKEKLTNQTFIKNSLGGMIDKVFNYSTYMAINAAYPGKFKPWELKQTSKCYWNKETAVEATKWLIEEKLKWTDNEIKKKLTQKFFSDNGLGGMINIIYNGSPFKAINTAYPEKFKPWELKMTSINYWNRETAIEATKWLIEEKFKWNDSDIKKNLTGKVFYDNDLNGILNFFNDSPYMAINAAFPGRFKPWELICTPNGYWNKETAVEATKWLIEEKLKWSDDDIKKNLTQKIFTDNKFSGMLRIFDNSPYQAVNAAYPGKFKPWELTKTLSGYWNNKTSIEAVKWLIEKKLQWTDNDIKKKLTQKVFYNNNLSGMLVTLYKGSPYQAVNVAYPGKFKPWELKVAPKKYWNKKTAVEATKWLIEEKLKWSDDEVRKKLTNKVFYENNLGGMLQIMFNKSAIQAIKAAYPENIHNI